MFVDSKPIVREGVCALLAQQAGLDVIAAAASLAEALGATEPDVVLVDLVLPDARGAEVITRLRERFARSAVVVLSDIEGPAEVELSMAAGAGAYVPRRATTSELLEAIHHAAAGRRYVHPSLRHPGRVDAAPGAAAHGPASLTAPERDVVRFLVLGHTNAEIAALSAVSLRTIEARRARALRKLGVRTRAELVRIAPHLGAIDVELG